MCSHGTVQQERGGPNLIVDREDDRHFVVEAFRVQWLLSQQYPVPLCVRVPVRSQLTDPGWDGYRASVDGCEWPELWSLDNRPCSRWSRNNWWIPLAGKAEGKTFPCLLVNSNALTWSVKVACDALTLAGWLWVKYRLLIRRVVTLLTQMLNYRPQCLAEKIRYWMRMDQQSIHTNDLSSECRVISVVQMHQNVVKAVLDSKGD